MADPAVSLLSLAVSRRSSPATLERIGRLLVARDLNTDRFLQLAKFHGVVPLVVRNLELAWRERSDVRTSGSHSQVEALLAHLQNTAREMARENLRLTSALLELLDRMEAAQVECVAYKGPVLARRLYDDTALRTFDDLDLLVSPEDVDQATAVLTEMGFQGWENFSKNEIERLGESRYARHFGHADRRLAVDLHWDLADPAWGFRTAELLENAKPETTQIGGRDVRTLPTSLLLLALCVHGSKHEPLPWYQLKWAVDVARLMELVPDWEATMEQARRFRVERATLLGLLCAHELVGAPLAPPVRRALSDNPGIGEAWALIQPRLFSPPQDELSTRERLSLDLSLVDRQVDRARFIVRRLLTPTPKDWEVVRLPSQLSAGYYLIRPFRLLASELLRVGRSGSSSGTQ